MRDYDFRILNVFTRGGRLTGNPLAVFEDATGMDDATMQALALQMNLSETTFILPSTTATARVRIFTPAYEMPFAGHPTLGTAHVVRSMNATGDALTLEMKAGVIPVTADGDRWTLRANKATWRDVDESSGELAEMLGLAAADIGDHPLWVNTGKEQLIVPVTSAEAVRRASPRADAFTRLKSVDKLSMAYVVCDERARQSGIEASPVSASVKARFFFPKGPAIVEDAATGSACANLGGWYCAMRPGEDLWRVVTQGDEIARPSNLYLSVKGGTIFVGGDVIEISRGKLSL